jgi:diadenylate cyclase
MTEGILEYLRTRTALELGRDGLDILIVYYVLYRILLLIRGTRAMQIGAGLLIVLGIYLLAYQLHLVAVLSILGSLISSFILVVVVVFQSDIRRGLMRVGSRWVGSWGRAKESRVIDEVVEATTELARHRIGAIIAFEQDANIDDFVGIHKGKLVDAAVTSELLVALFLPEGMNKLHDGAVIIRNLRVAKAGVFFPLHDGRVLDQSFGSRHRAALGITEETDAVVVVVSEERGTISLCFDGNLVSNLDEAKLRTALDANFAPKGKGRKRRRKATGARPATAVAPGGKLDVTERPPEVEERVTPIPKSEALPKPAPRITEAEIRVPSEPPPPLRPRTVPEEPGTADVRASPTLTGPRVGQGGLTPTPPNALDSAGAGPMPLESRPMPRTLEGPTPPGGDDEPPPSEGTKN